MYLSAINVGPEQIGGMAGAVAGSFIPIPGGSIIGSMIGSILGKMFGGKPSNNSAYIWFTAGPYPAPMAGGVHGLNCTGNVCGDEATADTKAYAAGISNALQAAITVYAQHGVSFNSPAFVVLVGGRDTASILAADHSGTFLAHGIANVGDAQGTVLGTIHWLSQYANPPLDSLAQQYGETPGQSNTYVPTQSPQAPAAVPASQVPPGSTVTAPTQAGLSALGSATPYLIAGLGVIMLTLFMRRS